MRRTLLAVALLGIALSACELRAEIAVSEDGSGTMGMVFALEPDVLALIDQPGFGADPFAEMRSDFADDPVAWDVKEFKEGNLRGIRATFAFESVADLVEKMDALAEDPSNDAALEEFTIEQQAGGWVFEGRSTDAQKEIGDQQLPIPAAQLENLLKVQLRVTLPGSATSHNADDVESSDGRTTFIWKPSLSAGAIDLRAATERGGGSFPVLPVALVLGAVAVLVVTRILKGQSAVAASVPGVSDADVDAPAGVPSRDGQPVSSGSAQTSPKQ